MVIETKYFGELEVDDQELILFPNGIYAFDDKHRYVLLYDEDDRDNPFMYLQCADSPDPCFIVVDPRSIHNDYHPSLSGEVSASIGADDPETLRLLAIAVIHEDLENSTVNLQSPVVINIDRRLAAQDVLDSSLPENAPYHTRHKLFPDRGEDSAVPEEEA
jgi:flagellar assembly factor FliW